jgi:hypothetical protein
VPPRAKIVDAIEIGDVHVAAIGARASVPKLLDKHDKQTHVHSVEPLK